MGFSNSTDTVFVKIVLHSLPNENRRSTLIYHKITVATGLLQNNAYGNVLTVWLCFIFTKSVSGYSGFASIDIGRCDRSRNQSMGL